MVHLRLSSSSLKIAFRKIDADFVDSAVKFVQFAATASSQKQELLRTRNARQYGERDQRHVSATSCGREGIRLKLNVVDHCVAFAKAKSRPSNLQRCLDDELGIGKVTFSQ